MQPAGGGVDIELPLVAVLADMEWEGARVNPSELAALAGQLRKRLEALEEEAYAMAGRPFNISSPAVAARLAAGMS